MTVLLIWWWTFTGVWPPAKFFLEPKSTRDDSDATEWTDWNVTFGWNVLVALVWESWGHVDILPAQPPWGPPVRAGIIVRCSSGTEKLFKSITAFISFLPGELDYSIFLKTGIQNHLHRVTQIIQHSFTVFLCWFHIWWLDGGKPHVFKDYILKETLKNIFLLFNRLVLESANSPKEDPCRNQPRILLAVRRLHWLWLQIFS